MATTLKSPVSSSLLLIVIVSFHDSETKECYRCKNAQTFSSNLTTSLLPLIPGKPCILEHIRCADDEHSCVYGLVSVVIAGGFWFHLSGCYVESINETFCFRGAGPVSWPGYTAQLRANYCLCGGRDEADLCNDSRFAKAVVTANLYNKKGGETTFLLTDHNNGSSTIKNRAAASFSIESARESTIVNACVRNGQYFSCVLIGWILGKVAFWY